MASSVATGTTSNMTTTSTTPISVAICVGPTTTSTSSAFSECSVAVWICHERARSSQHDPHRYTLEYFEFLDDTARWTHLDQLLLRYPAPSAHQFLHVMASSSNNSSSNSNSNSNESSKAAAKQHRRERLIENLKVFLEERHDDSATIRNNSWEQQDDLADGSDEAPPASASTSSPPTCHWYAHVPMDPSKIDAAVAQLLLPQEDVQVAYRGNLQLAQNKLLQHGLALWLQSQELYPPSTAATTEWQQSVQIQPGQLRSHMVMDRTAAACIHLLPPANAGLATVVGGRPHTNSLFGLLSQPCATTMGKAQLQVWLRQPLIDLPSILYRQDAVTALVHGQGKDSLREALQAFAGVDLAQLAHVLGEYAALTTTDNTTTSSSTDNTSIRNTKRPLKALYQLYLLSAKQLPALVEVLEDLTTTTTTEKSQLLQDSYQQLSQLQTELGRCQGLVEAVLDLDAAPMEYLVQPSFSPELAECHAQLADLQAQVEEEHSAMRDTWAQTTGTEKNVVKLEQQQQQQSNGGTTASTSWQFRVPDTNGAKIIETSLPDDQGIQMHRVLKNGVYFSTRALRQLSTQYQTCLGHYAHHSQQIVRDALQVATTYQTVVERAAQCVATLDAIASLAKVAAYSPCGYYCKPTLTDSDEEGAGIELKAARHPCVELQDDMEYIPNDVSLKLGASHGSGGGQKSQQNFLLVTGPNMGGKSTYIRTLGAVVCLAQIGSYVPCSSATINICHSLQARVGAGDLQERGISTFMAEMLEASAILKSATKRSLIIIDELGRGTSTFDGYGLAAAISDYLQRRIGCLTVFATHFHELTSHPNVQNCHVSAQMTNNTTSTSNTTTDGTAAGGGGAAAGRGELTFLYKVRPGPCLESFGIQVAEMAQVPSAVIQDAKRMAAALEDFGTKRQRVADRQFVQRFGDLDIPTLLAGYKNASSACSGDVAVDQDGPHGAQLLELLLA